jgi:hypothetical protein
MPRLKLTKSAIDALPVPKLDTVHWDASAPGFGVKVTPAGRKIFIVLYRTGGAGSKLRKYTIGPYGRVTLHQARVAAQKVFAAKHEGRDPAAEKRQSNRRAVADRIDDLLDGFITQRLAQNRSAAETSRLLRREVGIPWAGRSVHSISKRDVVDLISAIAQRGAPGSANKTLKSLKTFLGWCVGQAVLDRSPAEGVPQPMREVARDRVLDDTELAQILIAARTMGGPYGGIVEFLALTGQRREEVAGSPLGGDRFCSASLDNSQSQDKECQSTHRPPVDASAGRLDAHASKRTSRFHLGGKQVLPRLQPREAPIRPTLRGDRMASARLASHMRIRNGALGRCTAYRR